jgi:hypothetical protein
MTARLPVTVASWPKNRRETLRVRLDEYQGRPTVDIRTWWTDGAGELKPGRAGITVAVRHLPDLSLALGLLIPEERA